MAFIDVLDRPWSPATIAGLVVSVRIDTVQRQPIRAWSHVSSECREVGSPCVVHSHTLGTVEPIRSLAWVIASLFGVTPRAIFLGQFSDRAAMGDVPLGSVGPLRAAAASRVSVKQILCLLGAHHPTRALADPYGHLSTPRLAMPHAQLAERLAGQVLRVYRRLARELGSFLLPSQTSTASSVAIAKVASRSSNLAAAIASTNPCGPVIKNGPLCYSELTECLADNVDSVVSHGSSNYSIMQKVRLCL